jgi:hypothetical protein
MLQAPEADIWHTNGDEPEETETALVVVLKVCALQQAAQTKTVTSSGASGRI